eukprot:157688_1
MSTFNERLNYLVYGYVLIELNKIKLSSKYPIELNALIIHFLGNIFLKFDLVHENYKDCISKNGTVIKRSGSLKGIRWFSVCSSTSFSEGIHQFRIKCVKPKGDSIGIMSNTDIVKEKNKYHSWINCNIYYYHGEGTLYCGDGLGSTARGQYNLAPFEKDDIIAVKIDCNEWKVQFLRNDKLIGKTWDIQPDLSYHPFIGTRCEDTEYHLVI